ncbi:MAG: alpha/beta hydrolase, partial [Acidobacteriota bacterium]|nr:alpha/beta hydrolase [Acidobacteriota bacterium]
MTTRRKRALQTAAWTATAAIVLLLAGTLGMPTLWHLRALYVLEKVADPKAQPAVGTLVAQAIVESEIAVQAPSGPMRARLYLPRHPAAAGMVVVHGVHFDGVDDPRLRAFARALAGVGVPVLTPHITALTELRVEPSEIDSIGAAVKELARRTGNPVGVFGLSFAGGLALLTAADERYRHDIAYVFAAGAHADMARVARYYSTNEDARPNGSPQRLRAHPYGAMILIYTHPEDFFSDKEAPVAKEALRLALN